MKFISSCFFSFALAASFFTHSCAVKLNSPDLIHKYRWYTDEVDDHIAEAVYDIITTSKLGYTKLQLNGFVSIGITKLVGEKYLGEAQANEKFKELMHNATEETEHQIRSVIAANSQLIADLIESDEDMKHI